MGCVALFGLEIELWRQNANSELVAKSSACQTAIVEIDKITSSTEKKTRSVIRKNSSREMFSSSTFCWLNYWARKVSSNYFRMDSWGETWHDFESKAVIRIGERLPDRIKNPPRRKKIRRNPEPEEIPHPKSRKRAASWFQIILPLPTLGKKWRAHLAKTCVHRHSDRKKRTSRVLLPAAPQGGRGGGEGEGE